MIYCTRFPGDMRIKYCIAVEKRAAKSIDSPPFCIDYQPTKTVQVLVMVSMPTMMALIIPAI